MEQVKFNRKTWSSGNTKMVVSIPNELQEYLGLETECEVTLIPDKGKHGKFIALWKKENQE